MLISDARIAGPNEDRVTLTLTAKAGRVARCRVTRHRPGSPAAVLVGQTPDRAVRLVGVLFSLCGTAQRAAALQALEAALAVPVAPAVIAARQALVLIEALDQGIVRLGLSWAPLVGCAGEAGALRDLRRQMEGARAEIIGAVEGWARIGGGSGAASWPPSALADRVSTLRAGLGRWLPDAQTRAGSVARWRAWAAEGRTVAARALDLALTVPSRPEDGVPLLTGWQRDEVAAGLWGSSVTTAAEHPGGGLIERPLWRGGAAETGALARCAEVPVVADLRAAGHGLAARVTARLVDLARTGEALQALANDAGPMPTGTTSDAAFHDGLERGRDGPGVGLAAVDTARGLLLHRVVVRDGRVADWRIVAPTDWNAHPEGVLARAPLGWPAEPSQILGRLVHMLVLAVDPCVPYDLRVGRAWAEEVIHA